MSGWDRLLPDSGASGELRDLAHHERIYGQLDLRVSRSALLSAIRDSGLTGRGGAGFPSSRKIDAVRAATGSGRGDSIVVANGAEGEPASDKDKVLLTFAPHLVLDGLQIAAKAVDASEAVVYVHEGPIVAMVASLVSVRRRAGVDAVPTRVVSAPAKFISGQESALVSRIEGGLAIPRATPPPIYQRGINRRPTLVNNVETLAHMALVARFGADWFRSLGTDAEPGTMLFSVSGAVQRPGVVEAPIGVGLATLLQACIVTEPIQAVLVGGYHGTWISVTGDDRALCDASLQSVGGRVGAGVVIALSDATCGLVEVARIAGYLANQSAGQCGPCTNGLPAIAAALSRLAAGPVDASLLLQLDLLNRLVDGRGACRHPDGTVRMVRSALSVFAGEVHQHLAGVCTATYHEALTPIVPSAHKSFVGASS